MDDKHVPTRVPVAEVLAGRWSPRAFREKIPSDEVLLAVLEAARLAPSSRNEQPWRYIVGTRGDDAYRKLYDCLAEANQVWAKQAPVLMLSVASTQLERNGKPNRYYGHDTGMASMSLVIEAEMAGLSCHQMGGFDADRAREHFAIPEEFEPMAAIALGYRGDPATLTDELQERETAPRQRRPLRDLVMGSTWGTPPTFVQD
jgi:nitroreductase